MTWIKKNYPNRKLETQKIVIPDNEKIDWILHLITRTQMGFKGLEKELVSQIIPLFNSDIAFSAKLLSKCKNNSDKVISINSVLVTQTYHAKLFFLANLPNKVGKCRLLSAFYRNS